jgi:hypothetical protein
MPDVESVPVNVTVTAALRQPFALAAGVAAALTVGTVESFLIVTDAEAVPPALVAVQVYVTPLVFAVTVTGVVQVLLDMADWVSTILHVRPTVLVYQPFAPRVPVNVGVMVGGVVSPVAVTLYVMVFVNVLPATSFAVTAKLFVPAELVSIGLPEATGPTHVINAEGPLPQE